MEITLGHTYRWHATTENILPLTLNLKLGPVNVVATSWDHEIICFKTFLFNFFPKKNIYCYTRRFCVAVCLSVVRGNNLFSRELKI